MGVFTRFRDIINANINSMLDRAEDPEKMIRLMIQEMEDTLVEIKASCAEVMAAAKKIEREMGQAQSRADEWANRADLAVAKGRDDLAREALVEKRRYADRALELSHELREVESLIEQYQSDIQQLEDKLRTVREQQRVLVQRHIHARRKKQAQQNIRRYDTSDAFLRFEKFQNRIERMEAEADLVNFSRRPTLDEEFASLEGDQDIEQELEDLKARAGRKTAEKPA